MTNVHYASIISSLMYAMVGTTVDIVHLVAVSSKYMLTPGREHWMTMKGVLCYLQGTTYYTIYYKGKSRSNKQVQMHGFVDFEWVGDVNSRWSTNKYVFNLHGGAVSWMSRR